MESSPSTTHSSLLGLFIGLTLLTTIMVWLCVHLSFQSEAVLTLILTQILSSLGCCLLLGLGIAIPIFCVASIFGLLQMALLMRGSINPHLGQADFVQVLKTLISEFF